MSADRRPTPTPTAAERVRAALAGGGTVNMPGVYDALTARLAAEAGHPVLFVSGYSVSAARLGMPDLGYLTQTDVADAARGICGAVDVPVIVDADTGYGNALSARRTARLLHAAGAAGIFLEDQEWPKRCGHFAGKRVIPREEWLSKLQAVLDLRAEGVDLFLVARTDARAAVSLEDAIIRAEAARDLGVDAVFVEAPRSEAELRAVAEGVPDAIRVANMIERAHPPAHPRRAGGPGPPPRRDPPHRPLRRHTRGAGGDGAAARRGHPARSPGPPGGLRRLRAGGGPAGAPRAGAALRPLRAPD